MTNQKKTPSGLGNRKGAEISLYSNFATKILNRQAQSGYVVEISFRRNEGNGPEYHYLGKCDAARSLLLIARSKQGATRAEALERYFILSLSQHVHIVREHCNFWYVIDTERVGPTRYARYHLPDDIAIRLFKDGGR